MKACIGSLLLFITLKSFGQAVELKGEYRYQIKGEFYSTYFFDGGNFTLIEAGDLGLFYGEGKYAIKDGLLTLTFDSVTLDKEKYAKYTTILPKTETMNFNPVNERSFDIEVISEGVRYVQRYIKK